MPHRNTALTKAYALANVRNLQAHNKSTVRLSGTHVVKMLAAGREQDNHFSYTAKQEVAATLDEVAVKYGSFQCVHTSSRNVNEKGRYRRERLASCS